MGPPPFAPLPADKRARLGRAFCLHLFLGKGTPKPLRSVRNSQSVTEAKADG